MEKKIVYDFDMPVSRLGTHAEKYEARERFFGKADVEPFWVADMDLPTPEFLVEKLRARTGHPMFGYTEQYDEVFDAVQWWMKNEHQAEIESAWISLSPSVVTTISMAIQCCTEEGEAVAVLSPVYGPFFTCTKINKRKIADVPLCVENAKFEIDFQALEKTLSRPEVKLMLMCNPQNPGGRAWSFQCLEKVVALCVKYRVILLSDEIHSDIVYAPAKHRSVLNLPAADEIAVVAHSIGKTFNTSGLQSSFVVIKNPKLRSAFRRAQDRAHCGDINLFGKAALASALSPAGAEYKRQLLVYLHENTRQVCARLNQVENLTVMEPEATFLVWSDFRAFGDWQTVFRKLINEANVALSGGNFFGPAGEGWFRINCAHPRSVLLPAVERIVDIFSGA
ncbi:MalY/PatB family protein [Pontiella agarivorans]|uniref:cysteine-S-conjugate beta-lyase n=1 Tax=Pontiella agarivorans TaxID=3038953 RepID=A0ABU5MYD5_9BACT|nr:PatB family C-S lyase [Pontiella agarivorans]MDZ8119212.1 PatB family C-S lyase [Pontiella agarivorans]